MAHADTHGDSTPPVHSDPSVIAVADPSVSKRKRDDDDATSNQSRVPSLRLKHIQNDILLLLDRPDAQSSLLKHPLPNAPSQKKARLSEANARSTTIATKLHASEYDSLQQLKEDAASISDAIISAVRATVKDREASTGGRPSIDQLKQIQRAHAFEALVKELADKEEQYAEIHTSKEVQPKQEEGSLPNGRTTDTKSATNSAGTVLTLFGNAPTPKQLFSSMQHAPTNRSAPKIKSELPVEEMSLPNGITATKVMPGSDVEKEQTFEDSFAPPYSLAPLNPPKHRKSSSTRDAKVTWEFKDAIQRNRKGGYTVQPLTVGNWLSYGGVEDLASAAPQSRKQRTRVLSGGGEGLIPLNKSEIEEALAKEEDALFRKAYSSFAPTHDNANVIIPQETKNTLWWSKTGSRRYEDVFAIDPALLDESEGAPLPPLPMEDVPAKDEDFSTVIDDLEELDKIQPDSEPIKSKTDVEQNLREISELLETLASHQRIRNAALPSSREAVSRTPISPAPALASKLGKPDEPSEDEVTTYTNLQRELAYLILKLPPYAVAKLDGDQLSELGVSKLIKFNSSNTRGTMEEDLVTRQAKLNALVTANSIANLARPSSSAGQHYNTTASRTPAIGQAANTRYGQQYGSTKTPTVPQFQRQLSGQSTYSTPTAATAPRPSYGLPNQWRIPGPTPQPGYGQTNNQALYNRPAATPTGYGHYNHYSSTPQAQRYTAQPNPQYSQQRSISQTPAGNPANYGPAPQGQSHNRTASPVKGFPAVSMAPAPQQQRPIYPGQLPQQHPGSGRVTPTGYPSQPNTPVNGYRPPPGIAPRPASSTPQPPTQASPVHANGTS